MNYGLREIDTSFKNMLKEIYEGYKIIHYNPDVDWVKEYPMTATPSLRQWQIYKYIKEQIPEIE